VDAKELYCNMNRAFRHRILAAAAAAVFLGATVALAQGLKKDTKAPEISAKDLQGKTFKLSSFKGKVVFVNFFATWCPPCRAEFPELVKLHAKYEKNPNIKIISISLDDKRTIGNVKPFLNNYKAKHQVLLGDETMKAADSYEVQYIPTNYLIGKDGKVAGSWGFSGDKDLEKWQAAINQALKAK